MVHLPLEFSLPPRSPKAAIEPPRKRGDSVHDSDIPQPLTVKDRWSSYHPLLALMYL
jgi:hypothetical protein